MRCITAKKVFEQRSDISLRGREEDMADADSSSPVVIVFHNDGGKALLEVR